MPTNEKGYVLICRHDNISRIHNINFLLLVKSSQTQCTTLYACKNVHKGITTVVKVAKRVQKIKQIQDIFGYNSLTYCPKVMILGPKDSSL